MKKKTLWWLTGILILIVILLLVLKGTGALGGGEGTRVAVDTANDRTIIETVSASGKIYPETEVKIKPDVSGEIVELPVLEGDSVVKGQLLIKINPIIYNSAVTQAEASMFQSRAGVNNARELVAQAKAQMERTKANFDRNKELFTGKVISRMEYEQAEADYLSAKANYEATQANVAGGNYGVTGAQANLTQAQENLRRTTITAPTSGIISQLLVKKGERVVGTAQMDGTQILTIANLGRMEVRVDVSETDIPKVSVGDTSLIEVDAFRGRKFKGIVSKISVSSVQLNSATTTAATSSSTDQVTNYTVHIFILPESYAGLRTELGKGQFPFKPGMSAGVEIQTRKENGILSVPINAVTTRDLPDSLKKKNASSMTDVSNDIRQVLFVYNKDSKTVILRDVKTGIQNNEFIQVTSGLKKGDVVIVAPYGVVARTLQDKSKVKVVPRNQLYEVKEE
ncbi:efflux RND transporter periplasmic adaptor subunit [Taibaiella koreensis]|uniref:efflux RND transporter periplasmic adaptor subunit n=1 Tax=Taibaiella koreensis TaxID=1268548 RepID=UPI000E59F055|nr:efflux RND transporter periplasmic adaptor subunit [Taibaiella koreensis]